MADLQIKVDMRKLQNIINNEPARADAWLRGVGMQILGDIQLSFGTSPDGKTHTRGTVKHVASQPGYPPNIDTGALRGSMGLRKLGNMTYEIHDGVEYGVHLELGTEKMAARPFVNPVFAEWQTKIMDDAKQKLDID